MYRIGYLSTPTRESVARALEAFLDSLRKRGWSDGQNIAIEYRWAEGNVERLPGLASDLVANHVNLIVAPAASAAVAARKATASIPIVMMFPTDPVGLGLVASLSHPGGNVTGTTYAFGPGIMAKQLELLKEAVPNATRITVLWNPVDPGSTPQMKHLLETSARAMRVRLQSLEARGPEDFERAFAVMARERKEALMGSGSSTFTAHRDKLSELALKARLPTMYGYREIVEAGGLMAYGVKMTDFISRAASYVDNTSRRKSRRPARRAAHSARARGQPEDLEGARPHDSAIAAIARGRGDPMTSGWFVELLRRDSNAARGRFATIDHPPRSARSGHPRPR